MFKDLTGQTFNRLTVISFHSWRVNHKSGKRKSLWLCSCECGNTRITCAWSLSSGATKSCGCYLKDNYYKLHGASKSREYRSWQSMKDRCFNPNNPRFNCYGGKGITVCDRWLEHKKGFINFLEDMGERPENTSLDRINVHGNYEPSNCRWAKGSDQQFNQTLRSNNTSGKTGVRWNQQCSKWQALITVKGKAIHLGLFEYFDAAVVARKEGELKYYGMLKNDT